MGAWELGFRIKLSTIGGFHRNKSTGARATDYRWMLPTKFLTVHTAIATIFQDCPNSRGTNFASFFRNLMIASYGANCRKVSCLSGKPGRFRRNRLTAAAERFGDLSTCVVLRCRGTGHPHRPRQANSPCPSMVLRRRMRWRNSPTAFEPPDRPP